MNTMTMKSSHCFGYITLVLVLVGGLSLPSFGATQSIKLMFSKTHRGYGHQGVTKGPGNVWFVFNTSNIFRYESDDFRAYQKNLVKNMSAVSNPDFKSSGLDHLGAPEYHDGKVYTFAKRGPYPPMRLVWFAASDLSYKTGSFRNISIPKGPDNQDYRVSGGPHITGAYFYAALVGDNRSSRYIGKFRFPSAEFLEFIELTRPYYRPQGIDIDQGGNFYIAETEGGIVQYSPHGVYKGVLYHYPGGGIHEGFHFDPLKKRLVMSLDRKGHHVLIAEGDVLNYVPGKGDTTPPSAPRWLESKAEKTADGNFKVLLKWHPANDLDSGVGHYRIFRDKKPIATTGKTEYVDTGNLTERTTYTYEIVALNGCWVPSTPSRHALVTTGSDTTPPAVVSVSCNLNTNELSVLFNEPMDMRSMTRVENYGTSHGKVLAAQVAGKDHEVVLRVSTLEPRDKPHILVIRNVHDRAMARNPIAAGTKVRYRPDGLLGYWRFDSMADGKVPDASGLEHYATLTKVRLTTGKKGNALALDGTGDAVVPSLSGSFFPPRGTLSMWVKGDLAGQDDHARLFGSGWDDKRIHLFARITQKKNRGNLQVAFQALRFYQFAAYANLPNNTWNLIVISWDCPRQTAAVYVNGKLVRKSTLRSWTPRDQDIIFGKGFKGLIDEVRLYNTFTKPEN